MVKVQESQGRFTVTLPVDVVRMLQLKKGDSVAIFPEGKRAVMQKI